MPEEACKLIVKNKSIEIALEYINSNQGSKSQTRKSLVMAPYLSSNTEEFPLKTASFIAKAQTHMIENIKCNFKEQYKPNLTCNCCHISECNQKHLLECSALLGRNELLTYIPNYIDIFDNENSTEQEYIARLMMENLRRKKTIEQIN